MKLSHRLRVIFLALVLACTAGCDQTTKHLARTKLDRFDSVFLMGGWGELRLAENPGAFLSLGDSLSPALRTLVFTVGTSLGLLALFIYLLRQPPITRWTFAGLALVLAGGGSNLIDRITRQGLVTDFITLHCGPLQTGVFNIADLAVMIGLTILIGAAWWPLRRTSPPK